MSQGSTGRRFLIRGVNWLGDAVMTTPALLRLREAHPGAQFTLLTPAKLKDLWQNHPALDAVETFESGEGVFSIGRRLRAGKYDAGLVLPNSPRSAMEVWLARIPQRVGYAAHWRRWFLTQCVLQRPGAVSMHKRTPAEVHMLVRQSPARKPVVYPSFAHHIHQYLHLAGQLGANPEAIAPLLVVPDGATDQFAEKFGLTKASAGGVPLLGLNPAAEYGPAKRWPEERFVETAVRIQRTRPCRWLVFGLKADLELATRICSAISEAAGANPALHPVNLAGKTSLAELCAGLKLCRVLLTNDSGPMHVAAALGTPVVAIFGSTSPELTGPGLPGDSQHQLLSSRPPCAPCFLRACPIDFRCMRDIGAERAVRALLELLLQID